jgi:hypothetical protein
VVGLGVGKESPTPHSSVRCWYNWMGVTYAHQMEICHQYSPSKSIYPFNEIRGKPLAASKLDIEKFDFIFEEAIRLHELLSSSHEKYIAEFKDPFRLMTATINAPKEMASKFNFQIHLSERAQNALFDIAKNTIKSNNLKFSISPNELYNSLKESMYLYIAKYQPAELNGRSYTNIINFALRKHRESCKEITYYFPTYFPLIEKPYNIGIVSVIPKENLDEKITKTNTKEFYISATKEFADDFNCYVSIPIGRSSPDISEKRALAVSKLVTGILELFSFSYKTSNYNFHIGENRQVQNKKFHVMEINNGAGYDAKIQVKHYNVGDFFNNLENDLNTKLGNALCRCIELSCNPEHKERLVDRLIDAICWFGDARNDLNVHAKTVKIVTALERLVSFKAEKDTSKISSNFAKRVSSLIGIYHGDVDLWHYRAKKLYTLRSDLVHGNYSLYRSYSTNLDFNSMELCTYAIFSSCMQFNKIGFELGKVRISGSFLPKLIRR